jgi:PAS domain S-box-containing protein
MRNKKKSVILRKHLHNRGAESLRARQAKVLEKIQRLVHEFEIHQVELKLCQELHHAQVELAAWRDRYIDLYESSPLAYVTLDKDCRILESNLIVARMLGVERKDLLGTNFTKFITIESQGNWYLHRRAVLSNEAKQTCEIRIRRTDSTLLSVRADSIGAGYGSDGHFRTALVDVSQQKLAEEEREQLLVRELSARNELEAATKVKERFLSTVSHELRTSLTPILGWSRLLQDKKLNSATLSRGLEIIERNAKLQKQLIDDILDISDNITGKISLKLRPVGLPEIFNAAIDTVRSSADAKAIQIHTQFDEDVRLVDGDPNRLQQMIWNLLSNAVKFTPNGGRIEAQLTKAGSHIQIVVSDSGKGMPKDFLPFAFIPFSQADNTSQKGHRGLGLGLAIVRQVVEMHGGTVQVQSEEGKGTIFTIQLPIRNVDALVEKPDAPADLLTAVSGLLRKAA